MAGGDEFTTWPRQGQYWLLDREIGGRFAKVVGGVPTAHTRGIYAVPTTNRSLLLGPTAEDREDRGDRAVDAPTLEHVFDAAHVLVPQPAARARDQDLRREPAGLRPRLPRGPRLVPRLVVLLPVGVERLGQKEADVRPWGRCASPPRAWPSAWSAPQSERFIESPAIMLPRLVRPRASRSCPSATAAGSPSAR